MSYQNCPRCFLALRVRFDAVAQRHCPRCLGRHGAAVPMFETRHPARPAADGLLSEAAVEPPQPLRRFSPRVDADAAA
jgi:hypothetical protein